MLDHGIYPIFKPVGPTSFDMVAMLRKISGEKRIGHAGTLDPFASGVLIIAIGREYTKQISSLVNTDKEYLASIHLGMISTTDDPTGELKKISGQKPTHAEIEKILPQFIGKIQQLPPVYSAIKINGKPAHRRIRAGQKVELKPREVEIRSLEILEYEYPLVSMKVVCGKGVYIRSLARDIGEKLNTGAYVQTLQRTRVGEYTLADCLHINWEDRTIQTRTPVSLVL